MMQITVIGRDNGNNGYEPVLIYEVEVDDLEVSTVLTAFVEARADDLGSLTPEEQEQIEVLFAFDGSIQTIADYRE